MSTNPLPLSIITDVTVVASSPQVAAPTFNMGLIIGPSGVIPSYGINSRVRVYQEANFLNEMLSDGFSEDDPETICAQMYFGQSPPPKSLAVGRQDATAISAMAINSGGLGYVVGDILTVINAGASNGSIRVNTIGTNGVVTGISILTGGTNYVVADAMACSGGYGHDISVNVTDIGESCLTAAIECRTANPQWYPFMCTEAEIADHIAISQWALSQVGTIYFATVMDGSSRNGSPGNILKTLFRLSCKRTWMQYATTQGGLYPNQEYFVAAIMGQIMASNTQLQNSAFTEKFSGGVPLLGVATESLNTTQISNIEGSIPGLGPNGNLYVNYAAAFNVLEQGTMMAENVFFDQILNLDMLASNIQYAIMNLLVSVPKVPQTDAGQQLLIQAVDSALAQAALIGFIAPGIWEGRQILKLNPGTALPLGYMAQSPKYSTMNQADIQARKAPPIYVALIQAGAVHFTTINVLVQV